MDEQIHNQGGKSQVDIQEDNDLKAVSSIKGQAEERATAEQGSSDVDKAAESAIEEKVAALDEVNTEKVMAKEERKGVEVASTLQERQEGANQAAPEKAAPDVAQEVKDAQVAKVAAVTPVAPVTDTLTLDPSALERVAAARARDSAQARETLGLNTVEPNLEKQQQQLAGEEETKRSAWLKKAEEAKAAQPVVSAKAASDNKVESDEIFTASQADVKPVVPPEIEKQYLRIGDKFYHPKNTDLVAFEDKGNKLETRSNSENIAESMVRIAEARGWDEIKVSGSETFRKEVWLEAAARGMHVKGYSPTEQDKAELAKKVSESDLNKIEKDSKPFRAREKETEEAKAKQPDAVKPELKSEPEKTDSLNKRMAEAFAKESAVDAVKKHPELSGAAAAVAMMDKKAEADGLTEQQRAVVAARVRQNVVNSIERGDIPQVTVKEHVEVKREANTDKEYSR